MNIRNNLLRKLKSHGIEVSVNNLDEYYWKFISETNYEFSKFDGFLDLIEDDDFLINSCLWLKFTQMKLQNEIANLFSPIFLPSREK